MSTEPGARFATTRWSLVADASNRSSSKSREAMSELCRLYWRPVYAFIRRTGRPVDDAQDLTQAFFTRLLEKHSVAQADRRRGRFRSFLLGCVRQFLSNERDRERAAKRGGGVPPLPFEIEADGRAFVLEPVDDLTPEQVFDRQWANTVIANALSRVEMAQREAGHGNLFRELKPFLTGGDSEAYKEIGERLGMSEGALRVAVHRLRRQNRDALRAIVGETVDTGRGR
jgi:RNA polymerase sigma factor (sigma-70 family)